MDRKIYWGAIAGIFTTILAAFVKHRYGYEIGVETQGLITVLATGFVGWVIPMAESEIKRRMTNKMVAEAHLDPESDVDLKKVITDKLVAEAALDPTSAVTIPEGETISSLQEKVETADRAGDAEVVVPANGAKP